MSSGDAAADGVHKEDEDAAASAEHSADILARDAQRGCNRRRNCSSRQYPVKEAAQTESPASAPSATSECNEAALSSQQDPCQQSQEGQENISAEADCLEHHRRCRRRGLQGQQSQNSTGEGAKGVTNSSNTSRSGSGTSSGSGSTMTLSARTNVQCEAFANTFAVNDKQGNGDHHHHYHSVADCRPRETLSAPIAVAQGGGSTAAAAQTVTTQTSVATSLRGTSHSSNSCDGATALPRAAAAGSSTQASKSVMPRHGSTLFPSNTSTHQVHLSTLRMNPYVRCVHGDGVPEIKSISELLAQNNYADPAEADTPCLRPCSGPLMSVSISSGAEADHHPSSFGGSSDHEPRIGCGVDGQEGGSSASLSPEFTFTVESVATPNTFATLRTLHRQMLIEHHQVQSVLSTSAGGSVDGDVEDDLDAILPTSTTDAAAEAAAAEAIMNDVRFRQNPYEESLPFSDTKQTTRNELIVSPHSRVKMSPHAPAFPASPLDGGSDDHHHRRTPLRSLCSRDDVNSVSSRHSSPNGRERSGSGGGDTHDSSASVLISQQHHHHHQQQQQRRSLQQRDHRTSSSILTDPVAKLEESPYHYIMRNYVGGTFLYYSTMESKQYFRALCYRVIAQVRPILEQETLSPHQGLFPPINAPAFVLGDIHGNFEDLSFFLKRILIFHDFNLTPSNLLCLGDYVDRGPFSLECVMLLFSLKIMNASKIVLLRGNHEDRVVCGDMRTYGRGCFLAQCQTVFGYVEGVRLFREVTSLFRYLPLAAELVIPGAPNASYLSTRTHPVHPNLYVSQLAVPIHPQQSPDEVASNDTSPVSSSRLKDLQKQQQNRGNGDHMSVHAVGMQVDHAHFTRHDDAGKGERHTEEPVAAAAAEASMAVTAHGTYSTICDASVMRGQPLRHQAHEERIFCTHGGIPRFFGPPLEEGALEYLRSLSFPRMLTLFPNTPAAKDDPECAPDYFLTHLLLPLYKAFPFMAPEGFVRDYRRAMRQLHRRKGTGTTGTGPRSNTSSSQAAAAGAAAASTSTGRSRCAGGNPVEGDINDMSMSSEATDFVTPRAATTVSTARTEDEEEEMAEEAEEAVHAAAVAEAEAALKAKYIPEASGEDVRRAWYIMFDLMWSDPTPAEPEETPDGVMVGGMHVNGWGFGINARGNNVVSFSAKAVDTFLTAYNYAMLFRAHQEKAHGLRWSKSNKVLTVFSSSNYLGHRNGAGCVVVAGNGEIQMIEKVSR